MTGWTEIVLAALLISDLSLAAASRLYHCIKLAALQGLLLGLLPLVIWNWQESPPHWELLLVAAANIVVKCVALPCLLARAMRRANVRRELEPLAGYSASLLIALTLAGASFYFCSRLGIAPDSPSLLAAPVAFTTMLIGLFIIIARRKAITQAIGFLTFENGIAVFGTGMMLDWGLLVELGILLDVFVLVFVMGIAVFQISREFDHIDADRLNRLGDRPVHVAGDTAESAEVTES